MKYLRLLSAFLLVAICFSSPWAYAGITNLDDLTLSGDLVVGDDATITDDLTVTDDLTFESTLLAIGRVGASTVLHSSSTSINPSSLPYAVILKNVGYGTGLDNTDNGSILPNGTPGKVLTMIICSLGNSGSWKVTPLTSTGFSQLSFDTQGDMATLLYMNDTLGWIIVSNSGAVVTTKKFGTGLNPSND